MHGICEGSYVFAPVFRNSQVPDLDSSWGILTGPYHSRSHRVTDTLPFQTGKSEMEIISRGGMKPQAAHALFHLKNKGAHETLSDDEAHVLSIPQGTSVYVPLTGTSELRSIEKRKTPFVPFVLIVCMRKSISEGKTPLYLSYWSCVW